MVENIEHKAVTMHQSSMEDKLDNRYCSYLVMKNQVEELQVLIFDTLSALISVFPEKFADCLPVHYVLKIIQHIEICIVICPLVL